MFYFDTLPLRVELTLDRDYVCANYIKLSQLMNHHGKAMATIWNKLQTTPDTEATTWKHCYGDPEHQHLWNNLVTQSQAGLPQVEKTHTMTILPFLVQ